MQRIIAVEYWYYVNDIDIKYSFTLGYDKSDISSKFWRKIGVRNWDHSGIALNTATKNCRKTAKI